MRKYKSIICFRRVLTFSLALEQEPRGDPENLLASIDCLILFSEFTLIKSFH